MTNQLNNDPSVPLVPAFAVQCFQFVRKHGRASFFFLLQELSLTCNVGMKVQGIFRQSGSMEKIKELVKLANEGDTT